MNTVKLNDESAELLKKLFASVDGVTYQFTSSNSILVIDVKDGIKKQFMIEEIK